MTVISPISIASALALAAAGATPAGTAESELNGVLRLHNHSQMGELRKTLLEGESEASGVALRIANSVWCGRPIKSAYVKEVKETHNALAAKLPATFDPVNDWVAAQTDGRVTKLLEGPVDPLTVALLINAVYFKGSWAAKFDVQSTTDGKFVTANGETVNGRFMHRKAKMEALSDIDELGGASAVRLDYGSGSNPTVCAIFILPAAPGAEALDAAVKGLSPGLLQELLGGMRNRQVDLSIPRFSAEWGANSLKPALRKLGLSSAFDGSNVFSAISSDPEVHLDDVVHKAVLEVNEEGTVAAAATAAIMMTRSLPPPPLKLTFNRPFLMLVLHQASATPLFLARLTHPTFTM